MVKFEALRGFVLEELLARLLHDNGYRLLASGTQDPEALIDGAQGLLVRGRGANHQVDVLGELDLPLPFSLPLRVFVEAKFRGQRTGLLEVRNAHGTVHDVNEHYGSMQSGTRPLSIRRYHYRYTLFSASGFTKPAQRYALAQQISLVDLSNPGFKPFLDAVDRTAHGIFDLVRRSRTSPFPQRQIRTALRQALGTWPDDIPDLSADDHLHRIIHLGSDLAVADVGDDVTEPDEDRVWVRYQAEPKQSTDDNDWIPPADDSTTYGQTFALPDDQLDQIVSEFSDTPLGELLIGFPYAPFILVLHIDNPTAFANYADDHHGSDIRVHIEFADRGQIGGDWIIVPADGSYSFQLQFALPELLADWLLSGEGVPTQRARDVKSSLLSSIAVFRGNRLIRLLYEPHRHRQR
ncbi:hypothetical protein [Nocardia sp. NPDC052566]|uniref:hypothetical protein n=1 Tax=Nocardia sp. NPDC052566 TaxID=3364330 RepID=UPI0037CA6C4C